ncbi:MAG TPA: tetratricopeptide repeat protein [Chloroflexota bacterium]|nr:tetratricopeptide repeat protein [Chloroflexota bacterium]
MTFDVKAHYQQAVVANVRLWRQRLLEETQPDRWQAQQEAVWQAVAAGLASVPAQPEAARLAAELIPTMERWGRWLEWLPLLETAVTLDLPPDLHGRLLLAQGRIYFLNRNFSDAIRVQEAALALAETHQLGELAALAHYHLCNAFLGGKQYNQARAHGVAALALLSPTQAVTVASCHTSLGLIELETGSFAASEAQFQQALARWSLLPEPALYARTWLNLGAVYFRQSRWAEAKRCYEQAEGILAATASVVDRLKVLNGLGTLHYVTGAYREAEAVFRQGLAVARPLPGLFHLRGSLTHNLGNTLLALQRWGEAQLYLEKSITLWQQANDEVEQANSTGTLAELYEQQGEWDTAVACYDAALRLLAAYPDHQWAQKLITNFQTARLRCATQNNTDRV